MFRTGKVVVAALAVALLLPGCSPTGDSFAASLAERVIVGIGDDITPPYPQPHEAEYLAAQAIESPRLPHLEAPVDYQIDILSWAGHSGDAEGARIQIRVDVHVQHSGARSFGAPSYTEGRSTRCWELTVFGFHDYDSLKTAEYPCPANALAVVPQPAPLPQLPEDVDARLVAALEGASASTVDARVRDQFVEDHFSVKSAEQDGELVVALGIPSQLECAVAVRHADGVVEVLRGWDRTQLQPGERGCDPGLYFAIMPT